MSIQVKVIKNGEEKLFDLIAEFQITEGNEVNDYVLLTQNEVVEEDLIKLWTAKLDGTNLLRIDSEDSWDAIKNFMRSVSAISNINVNFINNIGDKTLTLEKQKLRILAVTEEVLNLFKNKYGEFYKKIEKELKEKQQAEENNKIVIPILENQEEAKVEEIQEEIEKIDETSTEEVDTSNDEGFEETEESEKDNTDEAPAIETPVEDTEMEETTEIEVPKEDTPKVEEPNVEIKQEPKSTLENDVVNAIDKFISNI